MTRAELYAAADDYRDAIAFVRSHHTGDGQARMAIARNCDPVGMVDALCVLFLAHMHVSDTDPTRYLDHLLAQLDDALGADE